MPFTHVDKNPGEVIRSADWNEVSRETQRLGGDKVDRAGDTVFGPLAVRGEVAVGTANAGAPLRIFKRQEDGTELAHGAVILGNDAASSASLRLGYGGGYSWIQGQGRQALSLNPRGGEVGVGTDAPKSRLSVAGGVAVGAGYAAGSAAPANSLIVEGSVGIGVAAPQNRLEVVGDVVIGGQAGERFVFHTRTHAKGDFLQLTVDGANGAWDWSKGIALQRATGNVGVGTTQPAARLHVAGGDLRLDGNREILFADNGQIRSLDNYHRILFRRSEDRMELREYGDIVFSSGATAGNETARAVLKASGRLGIGTADPQRPLHVEAGSEIHSGGPGAGFSFASRDSGFVDSPTRGERWVWYAHGGMARFWSGANRWTVASDGKLALGDFVPRAALDTGTGVMTGAAQDYLQAQFTMTGGGYVSWGGPGQRLRWTNRFIAIPVQRGTTGTAGHINLHPRNADLPGTWVHDGQPRSWNGDGVVLQGWEALYAVHQTGGGQDSIEWRIVHFTRDFVAPSNWLLVASVNHDDWSVKLGTGEIVPAGRGFGPGTRKAREIVTATDGIRLGPGVWQDMPNMTLAFDVGANPVLLLFKTGGVQMNPGAQTGRGRFQMVLDGRVVAFTLHEFHNNGWELRDVALMHMGVMTPGRHTVTIQWHAESATLGASWYNDNRTLMAVEL